jgi:hypothetical protein
MRVTSGLRDLRNLYVRANACVACHQNIEPDLLQAGHPELVFELDGQSVAEPKHWREKDPANGPRSWLTGQAVALREMSWSLTQGAKLERKTARWSGLRWLLAKTTAFATALPQIQAPPSNPLASDFVDTQNRADDLARRATQWETNETSTLDLMRVFAATSADFTEMGRTPPAALPYCGERLVLALERLAAATKEKGGARNVDREMQLLITDVRPLDNFEPKRFADHLQSLRNALAEAPR